MVVVGVVLVAVLVVGLVGLVVPKAAAARCWLLSLRIGSSNGSSCGVPRWSLGHEWWWPGGAALLHPRPAAATGLGAGAGAGATKLSLSWDAAPGALQLLYVIRMLLVRQPLLADACGTC